MSENLKMGVNWKYLDTLLNIKSSLLNQFVLFKIAINGRGNIVKESLELNALLSTFYLAMASQYDQFLAKDKDCIYKQEDYMHLISDARVQVRDLIGMTIQIIKWSQEKGAFSTLTESYDAGEAIKKG